jgi:SAM-dependent methyltransferase
MRRDVQPELLDSLPSGHPDAIHSRRDLRRINWWMNSAGLLARPLSQQPSPSSIVELGCGDATLALKLARRLHPADERGRITLLDRHPVVAPQTITAFNTAGWTAEIVAADVFDWLGSASEMADVIVANLFLHHFQEPELQRLLAGIARRTRCFISLDPRRGRWPLFGCRILPLLGCNHVTRNDARISVVAGFKDRELSRLWPTPQGWNLEERTGGLFSHLLVARRLDQ